MSDLAAWLERWLVGLVLAVAAAGLWWAVPPRSAATHHGITIALVVLVTAVGLGLDPAAVLEARAHTARVALTVLVPAVVLPGIAFAASRAVPVGPLRLGVLAAGVAPSEVAAVGLASLAGGSVALAAAVLIGSTVGCVLLAAPVLHSLAGSGAGFSSGSLLLSLLGIVGAPLLLGAAARAILPVRARDGADAAAGVVATGAVLVLIWLVAGQAHLDGAYLRAGLALAVFLAGSAVLASALTLGLPAATRVSLFLPVAMRDFAIAAGIASQAFGPPASAALGLYGVLVLVFGAATARLSDPGRQA